MQLVLVVYGLGADRELLREQGKEGTQNSV
jgi:hypothetical protein